MTPSQILISVIIPCRNEVKYIGETINAILQQKNILTNQIEIIVVDGNSNDGSVEFIKKTFGEDVKIIHNEKLFTPIAFNLGIKQSVGKYISIIGARSKIAENYLIESINVIETKHDVACVGGLTFNEYENNESEAIAVAMASKIGVGFSNFRTIKESRYVDTVGTPVFRRDIFDIIGYFDETLVRNQDDDLSYRIIKAGYKIWLSADITMKYYVRASIKNLFKQYFQYGYWKVYVNRKHKTVTTYRQLIPVMLLLFILLGYPIFYFLHIENLYPIILSLYIAIVVITSIASTTNLRNMLTIALAIFTLHLSYGSGYLKGIIDFIVLRKAPSNKLKKLTR